MFGVKILHTSDWHLGRAFHGVGMLDHQATFLDHLVDTVESESVDLVVVSGDIYDRGLPPVDAVKVAHDTISRLSSSRARVVITSGNHDSAHRLGFASGLIDSAGVHLRTDAAGVGTPVVIDDDWGPVAVYGIPYLDPDLTRRAWELPTRSHEASLGEAMRRINDDRGRRPSHTRSIVLAHAFVAGGQPSESERDITVGGVSRVPTTLFDGIDYTALGHLHGQQVLSDRIRYSGSPLAYSFSEESHTKGNWLIDLSPSGIASEFVEAPVPRPVARVSGSLAGLLTDPELTRLEGAWLQVTLTDQVRPSAPMEQVRRRFPHTLSLVWAPTEGAASPGRVPVAGRGDLDVTLDFVRHLRGADASDAERLLLQEAVESCCGVPDADTAVSAG